MNLLDRLRECVSEEREIEQVISFASGGSISTVSANTIEYSSNTSPTELFARVTFKNGRPSKIESGPPLKSVEAQNALLERARIETSHTHGSFVVSRVLFSERPLTGFFKWNDTIRIGPCPESTVVGKGLDWADSVMPKHFGGSHNGPPFPFLLEVRVPRSPNPFLESSRTLRMLDRFQYALTLLIDGNIRYAHWPSGRIWTTLKQGNKLENHLVRPGFSTGEDGQQDDFPIRNTNPASIYQDDDYYDRLWHRDTELFIPKSLADDLARFHSLSNDMKDSFIRACYWYSIGIQSLFEPAIAITSFSTAIECLLPRIKGTPCKECGKSTGPGPTQLFKRHIMRYGTVITALEKQRNELYAVRSALVHGSRASHIDFDFMSAQDTSDTHLFLLSIVSQRSLINWLRDPQRETWNVSENRELTR